MPLQTSAPGPAGAAPSGDRPRRAVLGAAVAAALAVGAPTTAAAQASGLSGYGQGSSGQSGASTDGSVAGRDSGLRGMPMTNPVPRAEPGVSGASPTGPALTQSSSNYGRPKRPQDKRALYKGRGKAPTRPLPPLTTYATAPRVAQPQQPQQPLRPVTTPIVVAPAPNYAAIPKPVPLRKRLAEEAPFDPPGVALGGLRLRPYIEVDGGYDTNPTRDRNGSGSTIVQTAAGLTARSDWSRHSFDATLRGSYSAYTSNPDANRPEGTGAAKLRIDILRDTRAEIELRGSLTTQRPGSPGVPGSVIGRPTVTSFGASVGGVQTLGRTEIGVSGLVDRTIYEDGVLNGGGSAGLSLSNFTAYGVRGRVSYAITPGLTPFIETTVDTRVRDSVLDSAGYARDSNGVLAQAGTTFEFTRTLTGKASAGYGARRYEDARLPLLAGPTFDASLVWSVTPLTTITGRFNTEFGETSVAGSAGALIRRGQVDVTHALLRNLNLSATGSITRADYEGVSLSETTWIVGLKAEYSFNRFWMLRASYNREILTSTSAGSGYTADVFLLGLRLQR